MNLEDTYSEDYEFSRISLTLASLGIVGIINAIEYLLGYGGILLISVEFASVFLAFVVLFLALLPSGYKLPNFRTSIAAFVMLYLIFQLLIQTMTSTGYLALIRLTTPVLLAGMVLYVFRGKLSHIPKLSGFRFSRRMKILSILLFLIVLVAYFLRVSFPSSDEFTIDWYSSIQFLRGLDPYINSVTAGVFRVFPIPATAMTPTMAGGYVTNLSYPSLSFLIMVPARLLHISPFITLIPIYLVPLAFIRKNINIISGIAVCSAFILQPLLLTQYSLGFSDILWMTLTALSLICLNKRYLSGALIGTAISLKQVPALLVPFMLILILKNYGLKESLKFIASSLVAFFAFNGYFILKSPSAYVHDMLAPEIQNLIGIGFGPSQYSFLGFIYVSRDFYTFMIIFLLVLLVIVYSLYTEQIQYGFVAFPLLMFIFNYRLLAEYLMYWPMMAALLIPYIGIKVRSADSNTRIVIMSRKHWKKVAVFAVLLIAIPVGAALHFNRSPSLTVNSLMPEYSSNGTLSYIEANVTYLSHQTSVSPLYFRFVGGSNMVNQNGYIWTTTGNISFSGGNTYRFNIYPLAVSDLINVSGSYRVIVYYKHNLGEFNLKIVNHE